MDSVRASNIIKRLLPALFLFCFHWTTTAQNSVIEVSMESGSDTEYSLGTGIGDFTRLLDGSLPHNTGTYGYASYKRPIDTTINRPDQRIVNGVHLPLKSRVMSITHLPTGDEVIYALMDLAFTSENIRREILKKIHRHKPDFKSANLIITATHTHSAPGGFSNYMGYEVAAPGYRPDIVEVIAQRTYEAILDAWDNTIPVDLTFAERRIADNIPIAFSRNALPAYNSNPEVEEAITPEENYLATDRLWQLIQFDQSDHNSNTGHLHSILNFFGAHPNRLGADIISSDTRGAASDAAEAILPQNGLAVFAQNAPGDIDSESNYRRKVDESNLFIHPPEYFPRDDSGKVHPLNRDQRVIREGEILAEESFKTIQMPDTFFRVSGPIDCELIYLEMAGASSPKGNYASTLEPFDYYKNDYFLLGGFGRFGSLFKPKLRVTHTTPPTIGLGAIARFDDRLVQLMSNLELFVRYNRLFFSGFDSEGWDNISYVWKMYRGQADKTVMLEGGPIGSALGFRIGGGMFNAFAGVDPVLLELVRDKEIGLHEEHTFYPSVMPLQIIILGNVAILGVSGEPGNIAGQRIERTVLEVLKDRGVKRVIVNGYANENTGYIFTPEEYPHQFTPSQCGFVLYGKWTSPVVRYHFEQLARAMLLPKAERAAIVDYKTQAPVFSDEWIEKASYQEFLQPVPTHKQKKAEKKANKKLRIKDAGMKPGVDPPLDE